MAKQKQVKHWAKRGRRASRRLVNLAPARKHDNATSPNAGLANKNDIPTQCQCAIHVFPHTSEFITSVGHILLRGPLTNHRHGVRWKTDCERS